MTDPYKEVASWLTNSDKDTGAQEHDEHAYVLSVFRIGSDNQIYFRDPGTGKDIEINSIDDLYNCLSEVLSGPCEPVTISHIDGYSAEDLSDSDVTIEIDFTGYDHNSDLSLRDITITDDGVSDTPSPFTEIDDPSLGFNSISI